MNMSDETGKRYGKWTVISRADRPSIERRGQHWLCRCECGNTSVVRGDHLRAGNSTKCVCCSHGFKLGISRRTIIAICALSCLDERAVRRVLSGSPCVRYSTIIRVREAATTLGLAVDC